MQLNRSISFVSSWRHTLLIATVMGTLLAFILIFLQPFDTYTSAMSHKNLKLAGYGLVLVLPIVALHRVELIWFKRRGRKWFLIDEIITLSIGLLLIFTLGFVYNVKVVNGLPFQIAYLPDWILSFGVPFLPIFVPLWAYLRSYFSQVEIRERKADAPEHITVQGKSSNETLEFREADFLMAQSQANYVEIFLYDSGDEPAVSKHLIRMTLSRLVDQIPNAQQVHRSYLINVSHAESLEGNTRKGAVRLRGLPEAVPVSPKHFKALKSHLQSHPKTSD